MTASITVASETTNSHATRATIWTGRWLLQNGVLVMLFALIIIFAMMAPNFLAPLSVRNILVQAAVPLVLAIPIGLMLMANEVDLSIGSNVAVSAVAAGLLMTAGVSVGIAILAAMLLGTVIGLINAFLVAGLGVQSLIVTLGGLAAYRGLSQILSPGPLYGFDSRMVAFANGSLFAIPNLTVVAIIVVAAGWFVLEVSPIGTYIRAIGVSREAARLSGLRVKFLLVGLFAAVGLASGIASVMLAARVNSAPSATIGLGLEIDVLTAALLGGVALGGGRGKVRGLVVGVLFLVILQNGLTMMNVAPAWSTTATGVALVVAAVIDRFGRARSA